MCKEVFLAVGAGFLQHFPVVLFNYDSLPHRQTCRPELVELRITAPLVPVMISPMVARATAYWEMIMLYKRMIAAAMVSVVLMPSMSSAGGLLGGGGSGGGSVLGIVGDGDSGALVTVNSGNAGDSGLVNVGAGGGDGALTANVGGGTSPVVDASVLGSEGIADVNANLGGVEANVNVGGSDSLIRVDVGTGSGGGHGGDGGDGGNDGHGSNGSNGANGKNGTNGGWFIFGNRGNASSPSSAGITAVCANNANPSQLMALFQKSSTRGWNRASGIQLIPIKVCADMRRQIANWLASNGQYHRMIGAVAQDPLISAALSRTQYRPGHVLGVHKQGATLMVYVF